MAPRFWLTTALAAAVVTLAAPAAARQTPTPTLGELAKKEQERRKALKAAGQAPAGKVLTNDDLPAPAAPAPVRTPEGDVVPAATGADAQADAAKGGAPDAAKAAAPVRNEAWWRQRVALVREELRRNEMFAEALQTRLNSLTADFTARDDPYQRARIADDRARTMLELDRVQAELAAGRKAIADIEEEARLAGVPPGWLR